MNDRDLNQLLRRLPAPPAGGTLPARVDFADAILARLPGMRHVIPGSHPGLRILVLAGALGLGTAALTSFCRNRATGDASGPPPLTLFQPGAVEVPSAPLRP